jgi:uncharacterized membrane protein YqjE
MAVVSSHANAGAGAPGAASAAGTPGAASAAATRGTESLIDLVRGVLHDLPGLVGDRVELFSLELHRAGITLVKVLAMTVVAAILGVTAWLAMWSILVGLLMAAGWHWALANGLVLLINLGAAAWAVQRVRRLMKHLSLPATRQHLMVGTGSTSRAQAQRAADEQRAIHEHPAAA